jgi:Fe2+ or Zn2+ uptake regulation protein
MDLGEIRKTLHGLGLKLTPQRELILTVLLEATEPLTAQEVFAAVRQNRPRISFDTVYRNLGLLSEIGLVNRINLKVRFNTRFEIADEHRHHLVCLGCGTARPVAICPFREAARSLEKEQGFRIVNHAFEVYGYCPGCDASRTGQTGVPLATVAQANHGSDTRR